MMTFKDATGQSGCSRGCWPQGARENLGSRGAKCRNRTRTTETRIAEMNVKRQNKARKGGKRNKQISTRK